MRHLLVVLATRTFRRSLDGRVVGSHQRRKRTGLLGTALEGGTPNGRPPTIDKVGTPLALAAYEILYRQGEASNSLYYLDSGAVMVCVASAGSEETIIAVHGPGIYFGARSLHEEVHNATATTLLASNLVRLSKHAVQGLVQTNPSFTQHFAMHMMRRTARLEED